MFVCLLAFLLLLCLFALFCFVLFCFVCFVLSAVFFCLFVCLIYLPVCLFVCFVKSNLSKYGLVVLSFNQTNEGFLVIVGRINIKIIQMIYCRFGWMTDLILDVKPSLTIQNVDFTNVGRRFEFFGCSRTRSSPRQIQKSRGFLHGWGLRSWMFTAISGG